MLTVREQMAQGTFTFASETNPNTPQLSKHKTSIPRKSPFLGTITEDGYCDFDVPEDETYISKDVTRAVRMDKSERARKQRRNLRELRSGCGER